MAVIDNGQQVQDQGAIWSGFASTGTTPEIYLPRGMDNLGQMAFITRGTTKFLSMLHTRFPESKMKNTREHRVHEISELDRVFKITVASSNAMFSSGNNGNASTHSEFGLSNDQASQIQEFDVLHILNVYSRFNSLTGKLEYSKDFSADFTEEDQCIVLSVGAKDSAGSGNTRVSVRRAFHGKGKTDFNGTIPSAPTIGDCGDSMVLTVGTEVVRGLPSFPEGGDAPKGFFKNPVIDNNFTQEFKYAVEITKESEIEQTSIGKKPLDIYRMLKVRQSALDIERAFFKSRKGKVIDNQGRVQYTMGGVIEFIPRDTDHFHTYTDPIISYPGLLDWMEKIPKDGGSTTRDCYMGITLYQEFKKAYYGSGYLRYNEEASKKFDIPIETLVGAGVELNVIPLYTLQEIGWGNKMLILDFSVPAFVPVTHSGWDMKVEKDIQQKGQQTYKEQWLGIKGLERRYAQYQHIGYFPHVRAN